MSGITNTREEARADVFEFIEMFYNRHGCVRPSATSVQRSLKLHVYRNSVSMKSAVAHHVLVHFIKGYALLEYQAET
jgi:hypothetical protein